MNNAETADLLDFISGRGKFSLLGNGMTTYPLSDDPNQQRIHQLCLELEAQGGIYRHRVESGITLWKVW